MPSPRCLEECVPPTASRRLTDLAAAGDDAQILIPREFVHLHEDKWRSSGDVVKARLLARCGSSSTRRLMARKTLCRPLDAQKARAFLEQHHLWGATKAKVCYGLWSGAELVSVATFSKRNEVVRAGRAHASHDLDRCCATRDARVVGGITKLLAAFRRDHAPDSIVTSVDRDWGTGANWRKLGFETVELMPPLVMAVDRAGARCYLSGRGVGGPKGRQGLPDSVLEALATDDSGSTSPTTTMTQRLAAHGFYAVHDAGVERLMLLCDNTASDDDDDDDDESGTPPGRRLSAQALWDRSVPAKTFRYGSRNVGVSRLLDEAAAPAPVDGDVDAIASWRRAGPASTSTLVFSAASTCFAGGIVEVRQRGNSPWRTLGLTFPKTGKSIYHAVYHTDDPSLLMAEYLKTAAALALAATLPDIVIDGGGTGTGTGAPLRCCHVGHGAGALSRFLVFHVPGSTHVSVDLDAAVCAAAASTTPPRSAVVVADGLAFFERSKDTFDCVFVDVFDGDNVSPPAFYGDKFHADVQARLAPGGCLVHNLHVGGAKRNLALEAAERALDRNFPHGAFRVDSLGTSDFSGNALIIACTSPLDRARLPERAEAARRRFGLRFDAGSRVQALRRVPATPRLVSDEPNALAQPI